MRLMWRKELNLIPYLCNILMYTTDTIFFMFM